MKKEAICIKVLLDSIDDICKIFKDSKCDYNATARELRNKFKDYKQLTFKIGQHEGNKSICVYVNYEMHKDVMYMCPKFFISIYDDRYSDEKKLQYFNFDLVKGVKEMFYRGIKNFNDYCAGKNIYDLSYDEIIELGTDVENAVKNTKSEYDELKNFIADEKENYHYNPREFLWNKCVLKFYSHMYDLFVKYDSVFECFEFTAHRDYVNYVSLGLYEVCGFDEIKDYFISEWKDVQQYKNNKD